MLQQTKLAAAALVNQADSVHERVLDDAQAGMGEDSRDLLGLAEDIRVYHRRAAGC